MNVRTSAAGARWRGWWRRWRRSLVCESPAALDVMAIVFEPSDGSMDTASAKVPRLGESAEEMARRVARAQRSCLHAPWAWQRLFLIAAIAIAGLGLYAFLNTWLSLATLTVVAAAMLMAWTLLVMLGRGVRRRRLRARVAAARRARVALARRARAAPGTGHAIVVGAAESWMHAMDASRGKLTQRQGRLVGQSTDAMATWSLVLAVAFSFNAAMWQLGYMGYGQWVYAVFAWAGVLVWVRSRRRWFLRLRDALAGKACADCGYGLEGAPLDERAGYLGPRRCPECGERWPCVPPGVRQLSKAEQRAAERAATMTAEQKALEAEKARRRASLSHYEGEGGR